LRTRISELLLSATSSGARPLRTVTPLECVQECEGRRAFLLQKAIETCTRDPDHDGIPIPRDQCPNTPRFMPVMDNGCPDSDGDGVPDTADQCPATGRGIAVNAIGCPVTCTSPEGTCANSPPSCTTDRCREVAVNPIVPPGLLGDIAGTVIGTHYQPVACPGDKTAPLAPKLTVPSERYNPVALSTVTGRTTVSVTMAGGLPVDGDRVPLSFSWEPATDSCAPVKYSIYIEYYHCHQVPGVDEKPAYLNAGWCTWQPYTYATTTATTFATSFEIGKVLFGLHRPFYASFGYTVPTDGPFLVTYGPAQWVRARVFAHDGNGNTSSAMEADRYYVIFFQETSKAELRSPPLYSGLGF
jgi:hypothetical protein